MHPDTTPPQPNHTVKQTRIIPEQYNPWNNLTNKSQAPEDGCINIRNMLSIKWGNKKQVTSSWSLFIQLFSSEIFFLANGIRYYFRINCCLMNQIWRRWLTGPEGGSTILRNVWNYCLPKELISWQTPVFISPVLNPNHHDISIYQSS
jgi:hypothetical protein